MRRGAPYSAAADASIRVAWDFRNREPRDLREAVRLVRKAYQDEVPVKLHDGPDVIGEGGTPRFASAAEGYLFGKPTASDVQVDPETGTPDAVSYYHTPFRAALCRWQQGNESERRRGRIVSHITIGDMGPVEAAMKERAHPDDAKLVAESVLRMFLRGLSDMKVHIPRPDLLQESSTAA